MTTQNGKGAIFTEKLSHIKNHSDIAGDAAPFDWNNGYDITSVIKTDLLTKNQGQAGSCGGEATSYKEEVVHFLNTGAYEPKSSRYIYGQCFAKGGGSTDAGLISILTTMGTPDTSLFSDYPSDGSLPTEAFMENVSDITELVNENASGCILGTPIYINEDMESLAKAIRDTGGIICGISGQDNGTWESEFPQAPTDGGDWRHWLFFGKALTINGKQYLGFKNSWGSSCGVNGWQYIDASYIPFIWRAFSFVNLGEKTDFTHTFDTTQTYKMGTNNSEIIALQKALKIDGEFPVGQIATGYFGSITEKAVINFQKKYASDILTPIGLTKPTGIVSSHTLAKLNQLFSKVVV